MFNLMQDEKRYTDDKVVSILVITLGDKRITDTAGACALTGFSVSNISKLARSSKIASQKQGKGRLIDIQSLKSYYESERRTQGIQSQIDNYIQDELYAIARDNERILDESAVDSLYATIEKMKNAHRNAKNSK